MVCGILKLSMFDRFLYECVRYRSWCTGSGSEMVRDPIVCHLLQLYNLSTVGLYVVQQPRAGRHALRNPKLVARKYPRPRTEVQVLGDMLVYGRPSHSGLVLLVRGAGEGRGTTRWLSCDACSHGPLDSRGVAWRPRLLSPIHLLRAVICVNGSTRQSHDMTMRL